MTREQAYEQEAERQEYLDDCHEKREIENGGVDNNPSGFENEN